MATRDLAHSAFNLKLRVGMVAMATITSNNRHVLVAQYRPSKHYRQAMFLGDGLGYAERLIKDAATDNPYLLAVDGSIPANGDFTGFECRWNEIPSPHEETISLLVQARAAEFVQQEQVYATVIKEIHAVYGDEETCHPLRQDMMTLSSSKRTLSTEVAVKTAMLSRFQRWCYAWRLPLITALGRWLMRTNKRLGTVE